MVDMDFRDSYLGISESINLDIDDFTKWIYDNDEMNTICPEALETNIEVMEICKDFSKYNDVIRKEMLKNNQMFRSYVSQVYNSNIFGYPSLMKTSSTIHYLTNYTHQHIAAVVRTVSDVPRTYNQEFMRFYKEGCYLFNRILSEYLFHRLFRIQFIEQKPAFDPIWSRSKYKEVFDQDVPFSLLGFLNSIKCSYQMQECIDFPEDTLWG